MCVIFDFYLKSLLSGRCSRAFFFFFFKQKTAYAMRISDWSSDVCSSDLAARIAAVDRSVGLDEVIVAAEFGGAMHRRDDSRRHLLADQLGRASCRERVCQYV